ncbi:hypothetical protein B0J14DRAFT_587495 [Halenospora varia]|nr:hypothetical protein B0J14DRAFT_587495 [Halenospora varia]
MCSFLLEIIWATALTILPAMPRYRLSEQISLDFRTCTSCAYCGMDQRIIFPLVTRVANQNLPRASRIHLRQMLLVMLQAYFPYYPVAQ